MDLVLVGGLTILLALGIVDPADAFVGFGNTGATMGVIGWRGKPVNMTVQMLPSFLLAIGIGSLLVAINRGVPLGWSHPWVIAGLMIALIPPLFSGAVSGTKLKGSARDLAVALRETRSQAIIRNTEQLVQLDLEAAEAHGTLDAIGSVYSPENDAIYDGIHRPGADREVVPVDRDLPPADLDDLALPRLLLLRAAGASHGAVMAYLVLL